MSLVHAQSICLKKKKQGPSQGKIESAKFIISRLNALPAFQKYKKCDSYIL